LTHIASKHSFDNNEVWSEIDFHFLNAVRRFNEEKNTRFAYYMYVYIDRSVKNYYRRHESLFGKRNGNGRFDDEYSYHLDIDDPVLKNSLIDKNEESISEDITKHLHSVLTEEEALVVENFFGLGEYAEPVFNERKGKSDNRTFKFKGEWKTYNVTDEQKIRRVAKLLDSEVKIVRVRLNNALDKLRKDEGMNELCDLYIKDQEVDVLNGEIK
jgi:hypothetical protein